VEASQKVLINQSFHTYVPAYLTKPEPPQQPTSTAHADPDEVDISQHFYEPQATRRPQNATSQPAMSDDQLRQMMLGFDPSATPPLGGPQNPNANPFAGFPGMGGMEMPGMEGMGGPPGAEEPMMKMLQQMYKDSVYSYLKKTGEMK